MPEVTIDYTQGHWLVQVTSLPATERQAMNAQREAQSKLLELEIVRRSMDGNAVWPVLLVNKDALTSPASDGAMEQASRALDRLKLLTRSFEAQLMAASTVAQAADQLAALN